MQKKKIPHVGRHHICVNLKNSKLSLDILPVDSVCISPKNFILHRQDTKFYRFIFRQQSVTTEQQHLIKQQNRGQYYEGETESPLQFYSFFFDSTLAIFHSIPEISSLTFLLF